MSARLLLAVALAATLAGCVVLPVYKVQPDEPMATVSVRDLPDPAICVDGVGYKPASGGKDVVLVPAGKRVSLYSSFYASDGYMNYYCTAGAAYTFGAGSKLVAALEHDGAHCRIDLVQENADTPTGLAPEPSLGPSVCNPYATD